MSLAVTDPGRGVAVADHEVIFERDNWLESSRTRSTFGGGCD